MESNYAVALTFGFANGTTTNWPMELRINGSSVGTVSVALNAGTNTIRLPF